MRKAGMLGLVFTFVLLAAGAAAAESAPGKKVAIWPQWRGVTRDGKVQGAEPWPQKLAGDCLQRVWRVELGPSYSGPIVSEDRVFVTETANEEREVVRALDRATGRGLWRADWSGAMKVPFFAKSNGDWIRATPATDGENLFVAGMRDLLVCLDPQTGATRWRVDFVEQLSTPLPDFGFVSSPLIEGDFVYVQAGAGFCKLDKQSGKVIWRTLVDQGGMWGSAFSSPLAAELGGQRQMLVQTRDRLAGVEPAEGQVLWSREIPAFRGMNILTPTLVGEAIFTTAYGGKAFLLSPARQQSDWRVDEAWTNKVTGYMSSPVVIDDHVYLHLRNKRFTCIDARTGESRWTTEPFGDYWSLVANGKQILALDERGELLLIEANPAAFTLIDRRQVSEEPTWAHLAVCGDELFIRELHALSVYRWSQP